MVSAGEMGSVSPLGVVELELDVPSYAPTPLYLTSSRSTNCEFQFRYPLRCTSKISFFTYSSDFYIFLQSLDHYIRSSQKSKSVVAFTIPLSFPYFSSKPDPNSISRLFGLSSSFNANVSRTHRDYQAGRELICGVDAYHTLQKRAHTRQLQFRRRPRCMNRSRDHTTYCAPVPTPKQSCSGVFDTTDVHSGSP